MPNDITIIALRSLITRKPTMTRLCRFVSYLLASMVVVCIVPAEAAVDPSSDTCPADFEVCVIPVYIVPGDTSKPCSTSVRYDTTIVPAKVKRVIWALVDSKHDGENYEFEDDSLARNAIHLTDSSGFVPKSNVRVGGKRFYIWDPLHSKDTTTTYKIYATHVSTTGDKLQSCIPGDPTIANRK